MSLQEYLATELNPINSALQAALLELPKPCQPIASHIFSAGGKRLRPLLTILFGRLLGFNNENIYRLAICMEMLHAATLLHDDILDAAATRRGQPAAHLRFGAAQAILTGDALLALGNAIVAEFNNPAMTNAYSQATVQTAAGEILEMASLGQPLLTHAEYLEIAKGKTACLIAQACRLGALAASAPTRQIQACHDFGLNLGMAFQLVDDALDFAPAAQTGKPTGGDLCEAKMTPPLRMYRAHLTDKTVFDQKFRAKDFAPQEASAIAAEMEPFIEQTLQLADGYLTNAKLELSRLPDGKERAILNQLADYVRSRKK